MPKHGRLKYFYSCHFLAAASDYLCIKPNQNAMDKSFFNRYVWLIDLINRHGYITIKW